MSLLCKESIGLMKGHSLDYIHFLQRFKFGIQVSLTFSSFHQLPYMINGVCLEELFNVALFTHRPI